METTPLLLYTLPPDVLQAIVRLSCDGMNDSEDNNCCPLQRLRRTRPQHCASHAAPSKLLSMALSCAWRYVQSRQQTSTGFQGDFLVCMLASGHTDLHINILVVSNPASIYYFCGFGTCICRGLMQILRGFTCVFPRTPARSRSCESSCRA